MATKTKSSKAKSTTKKGAKPAAKLKASAAAKKENARLRDERVKSPDGQTASERAMADSPKSYDPNKCGTPRCKGKPALTHLGKPLCQKCWDRQCANEEEGARAAADIVDADTVATNAIIEVAEAANAAATAESKPNPKRTKKSTTPAEARSKRVSALDAAAQVLEQAGGTLNTKEMIAAMAEQKLWTSPGGKTPHATLYSAILRETSTKGTASRFLKMERGRFAFNAAATAGK